MKSPRRVGWSEGAVLLLGIVVVTVVAASAYHSSSTFSRDVPRAGAVQDIELHLGLSHLRIEEWLGGDASVDVDTEVYGNIDKAFNLCRKLINGGPSRLGRLDPLTGDSLRPDLLRLCDGVGDFRALTAERLAAFASSASGTASATAYDAAFRHLQDLADDDIATIERVIAQDRNRLNRVGIATVLLLATLFCAMTLLVRRNRRTLVAKSEEVLRREEKEAHLATIVQSSGDAIISISLGGEILSWNAGAEEMLGYKAEEIVGRSVSLLVPPDEAARQKEILSEVRHGRSVKNVEGTRIRKDGTVVPVAVTASPVRNNGSGIVAISGVLRDISDAKALELALERRAYYDELTELPNRALLHDRMTQALAQAARSGRPPAVVLVDLDNFKAINDSLGHGIGDRVLVEVAERLCQAVRPMDTVARLGGDEFVVMLADPAPGMAIGAVQRVLEILKTATEVGGATVIIGASAGVAIGEVGQSSDELLANADAAMYAAKAAGKGHWQVFAPEMHRAVLERLELTTELAGACDRGELFVVYQPIVELATGRVVGAEALVRWRHPTRGLVSPLDFISIAEESGQIVAVGTFVLGQALAQLRRCQADDPLFYLTVNVSPVQFRRPDFLQLVAGALDEAGVDAGRLVLEITETGIMTDVEDNIDTLSALRESGIRIAIDDFGTGYSSIAYLKRLPVDIVKIDKSLVDGVATEAGVWALAKAILGLVDAVGLGTVAEGIEDSAQVAHLEALGCTRGQGYHFARPMSAAELDDLVARGPALPEVAAPATDESAPSTDPPV